MAVTQCVDVTRRHVLLTVNPKRSGCLEYLYPDTGETVVVPNVPYNQPATYRVEYIMWDADRVARQAAHIERYPPVGATEEAVRETVRNWIARAERMRSEARKMAAAYCKAFPAAASRMDLDLGPMGR